MNMVGNLGGFVSSNAFPLLNRLTGGANTYFYTAALLNLLGLACWMWMKPRAARSQQSQRDLSAQGARQ